MNTPSVSAQEPTLPPDNGVDLFDAGESHHVIAALEAQYEINLFRFVEREDLSNEGNTQAAHRFTRHFLFNYFTGFFFLKFIPTYKMRPSGRKTIRQTSIERAIHRLAQIDTSRHLMSEYFIAGVNRDVHRKFRELVNADKHTLHPRLALFRSVTRLGLADDWEKLSTHGIEFGLSGFSLLFHANPGVLLPEEFETLIAYARQLADERNWVGVRDVFNLLSTANVSSKQQKQLLEFAHSMLDTTLYPYSEPDEDLSTKNEKMEVSSVLKRVLKVQASMYGKRIQQVTRLHAESRPSREHNSMVRRREEVVRTLTVLAFQSDEAREALRNLTLRALEEQKLKSRDKWVSEPAIQQFGAAVESLLLVSMTDVRSLETLFFALAASGKKTLSDDHLEALREANLQLDEDPIEFLLEHIRAGGDARLWSEQILANIPRLSGRVINLLREIVPEENDISVLKALVSLYKQLRVRNQNQQLLLEFEQILATRLRVALFDREVPFETDWVSFVIGAMKREQLLRTVLEEVVVILRSEQEPSLEKRCFDVLHAIAQQAEQMIEPDAYTLAACILIDPHDWIRDGSELLDRVDEARHFFESTDRIQAQRVVQLLDAAMRSRSQMRMVIVQSFRTFEYTDLTLPLLEQIMDEAMAGGFGNQKPELFVNAFKSVAGQSPLTPQILRLLQIGLLPSFEEDRQTTLSAAVVYREVLPLLTHEIAPDSVLLLIELVQQCHCLICGPALSIGRYKRSPFRSPVQELRHRYAHIEYGVQEPEHLILVCALQALTNVSDLSPTHQDFIERVYRTSWLTIVKALSLRILCNQQPIRERTIALLENLLRRNAEVDRAFSTPLKDGLHWRLSRRFHEETPPMADWESVRHLQTVAVYELSTLLQDKDLPSSEQYQHRFERDLLATISLFRQATEARWTTGGTSSEIPISKHIDPDQDWSGYPSDLAYSILYERWVKPLIET